MKIYLKILLSFAVILGLFVIVAIINVSGLNKIKDYTQYYARSENIVNTSVKAQRAMMDIQSNFRGFILTGNDVFLDPITVSKQQLDQFLQREKQLVLDSHSQQILLDSASLVSRQYYDSHVLLLIEAKKRALKGDTAYFNATLADNIMKLKGKKMMDHFKAIMLRFDHSEELLRSQRKAQLHASLSRTKYISLIIIIFTVLTGIGIAVWISRNIRYRIMDLTDITKKIAEGNYSIRIVDPYNDELSPLSDSFNELTKALDKKLNEGEWALKKPGNSL